MRECENMRFEIEEKISPLSNRRNLAISSPSPVYFYPFVVGSDSVCSLDMVRLKLRMRGDQAGVKLDEMAATFPCDGYQSWSARVKPGGWRILHNFEYGESSVSLGIGWMSPSCSIDMAVGFLEFNPNKVAGNDAFALMLGKLREYVARAELVRYDLALDVPVARNDVRLAKDGRKYKSEISSSITEYLGVRNSGGYVKVYDKQAESELDSPLTRIELTCDGRWSIEKVRDKWPVVYWPNTSGDGLTGPTGAFVNVLAEMVDMGRSIEPYLMSFCKDTRRKVRKALVGTTVEFPFDGAVAVLCQASAWAGLVASE